MRLAVIISAILWALSCAAQKIPDLRPKTLETASPKPLGVPAFSFFPLPQSDTDGDFFFHTGSSVFMDGWILKLSHGSYEPTTFKIPNALQDKYKFLEFSVSPAGDVWMLVNSDNPDILALEFDSKGEMRGKCRLDLALDQMQQQEFAALDNGTLLIAGTYTDKAPRKLTGHSFAALFDGGTGQKIKDLRDAASPASDVTALLHEGEAVAADDGNIYELHENQVVTISPSGEIVKRMSFTKPVPDLLATKLRVSAGEAAIWLTTVHKDTHQIENSFLVLDLLGGQPVGWYVTPPGMVGVSIGFSRADGFIFLKNTHGHFEIMTAGLR